MKTFTKTFRAAVFAAMLFSFISCEREILKPDPASVKVVGSHNAIEPYNFDWEDPNLNWMPYPAGQPQITVPWTGAGSLFGVVADDVLADRKKTDGWKLVYNTFSPTVWNKNPYFMLYNKYRGLVRIYLYINDIQFAESSYLQDGLYLGSSTYKLLNFADKEIVDPAAPNVIGVDRVQPKPYNGAPLANNKWYFLQYEIAYDGTIVPTTSSTPPQISFYANSINIQQITLGGTIEANVNGNIGGSKTSASQNFWGAVTPGLKTLGMAGLSAIGAGAMKKATLDDNGKNNLGINSFVWKTVKAGIDGALKTATGNIPGAITSVLSAIIGGSSSSAGQTVNLTVNGTLKVDGSQTGTGSLPSTPVSMYIPGSIQKNTSGGYNVQGYVPLYNEALGVFNISSKPTIVTRIIRTTGSDGLYTYDTQHTIKPGTLNLQFNPIVSSRDATITGLTAEVIAVYYNTTNIEQGKVYFNARMETIKGFFALTGRDKVQTINRSDYYTYDPSLAYVRVSFVVKPNDGSPEAAIVKTFEVNREQIWEYR